MTRLRVINWNIHGAFVPGRASYSQQARAWHLVASWDADLVLLQEVGEAAIPGWVADRWDLVTGHVGQFKKKQAWGSVIAARKDLNLQVWIGLKDDPWLVAQYDYLLVGKINLPDGESAYVASVHAPSDKLSAFLAGLKKPNLVADQDLKSMALPGADVWCSDFAFVSLDRVVNEHRFIIGGDWNTGRLFDNFPDWEPPSGSAFFYRARKRGWVDCHGGKPEEQTYFKKGNRPYQLDHIFCDPTTSTNQVECSVRAEPIVHELSDHAPIVTEFEF